MNWVTKMNSRKLVFVFLIAFCMLFSACAGTPAEQSSAEEISPTSELQLSSSTVQPSVEKEMPPVKTGFITEQILNNPSVQATGMWQARQTCYDFAEAYTAQGGNCTVVDLPKEGITGNDHFLFQDLNNDVIANHVEKWIQANVK